MYGMSKRVTSSYEEAVPRVKEELKKEGFGVLSEIDVKRTLKEKLDVEFRKYIILGACNPPLAHQALSTEIDLGLLLPCNVIVYDNEDGTCTVAAVDAEKMLSIVGRKELEEFADQVNDKLSRVLEAL